jgi:serine/threonine protein kinase
MLLIECPRTGELERLLADPRDEQVWETLLEHLDRCPTCRERIDRLHAAERVIPDQPASWRSPPSSAALDRAIASLRAAAPPALPSSIGAADYSLPFLRPISREGYLGRLGNYDVRRIIGRGGMGIVLEAEDPRLKRTVAIKIISPWAALDEESRSRFLREAQAAAAVTHENVVAIHSVEEVDDLQFLVLEHVSGESLDTRLRRAGAMPLPDVIRLGAELARGLAAAHVKCLIHRDIKPANILLVEDTQRAKIADFGLAKMGGADALTISGTLLGTPEFMSPEQAQGEEPDERSDLFSLAAVLYVAATGVSPFRGATLLETLDNVRRCQPRPLRELDASLPDWFCDLIHRLLAKDPQRRIGWASAVATLFEDASAAKTLVDFRPDQATARIPPLSAVRPKQQRTWIAAAAALVVAGLFALLAWSGALRSSRQTESVAVKPEPVVSKSQQPKSVPPGFTIASTGEHFAGLAAAIAAAGDGQTIEVHGNGPFLTPPLTIEGKRLTIRAAADGVPVFMAEGLGTPSARPFLQTDADLRLEGLEVRWAMEVPVGRTEFDFLARCIIAATHGKLQLAHCRVISTLSEKFNACAGGSCPELVLKDCHLIAKDGVGVFFGAEPSGNFVVEGCLLENRIGVSILQNAGVPGSTPPRARLWGSTLIASRGIQLMLEAPPRQPLPIAASHNLFDCEHLVMINVVRPPRLPKNAAKLENIAGLVQATATWTEQANVHRAGMNYMVRGAMARPATIATADIDTLPKWLELWKLPIDVSIAGDIRYEPRANSSSPAPPAVSAVDNPTGPVPAKFGARPDRVGPGDGYRAWRSSSEYLHWPSDAAR